MCNLYDYFAEVLDIMSTLDLAKVNSSSTDNVAHVVRDFRGLQCGDADMAFPRNTRFPLTARPRYERPR